MKKLHLSYAEPETWRDNIETDMPNNEWQRLRSKILRRDDFTCQYCGFKAEKYQIVHHIDGNPNNNNEDNLETVCGMCNVVHHSGLGCEIFNIVDLYEKSKYTQNEIIKITRKMRVKGKNDDEIKTYLGLKKIQPFKMNKTYLKKLYGFVTSRRTDNWIQNAIDYGYQVEKQRDRSMNQRTLEDIIYLE